MDNVAVIDLGSNTFHLLIAQMIDGKPLEIFRKRSFVGLSEGGIEFIKPDKIKKGLVAVAEFKEMLDIHHVKALRVVGTSVLREAVNSRDFVEPCEAILHQSIDVIDGQEEARLIFKGVELLGLTINNCCIVDIGGGSVELIIVKHKQVIAASSLPIGVGVLFAQFHHEEPISLSNYTACKDYIKTAFAPFLTEHQGLNLEELIGASGSFEVLKDALTYIEDTTFLREDVLTFSRRVIQSNLEERLQMKGIPEERAQLIVVGLIIVEAILELTNAKRLSFSPYAIKEGILAEFYE